VGTDITVDERARIETTLAAAKAAMQGQDREVIQRATHDLNDATKHLAEVMMNRSVREALTGRSVDSV
jgi:molecular chaperone HscA